MTNPCRPEGPESRDPAPAPWDLKETPELCWVAALISILMFGVGPIVTLLKGTARPPLSEYPVAGVCLALVMILAGAGLFLRINAARLFLAGLQVLLGLWVFASLLVPDAIPGRLNLAGWKLALYGSVSFVMAGSLAAPPARRACSRWGLLRKRS